jgi:hypothetical protein
MKNTILLIGSLLLLASLPQTSCGQAEGLATRIIEARKANAAKLQQYSWECRTEYSENDKVLDTLIESVTYGFNNQLQRTVLNNQEAPLPHGFVRKRVAEKERERMEKYLKGLRAMLDQYTLPTSMAVNTFVGTAVISAPDADGVLQLTGNNVVTSGDTLTMSVQAATKQMKKVQITTSYEGDPVTLTATYRTLASGLTHMAFAEISIPAKQISLQIHNFNFNPNN